MYLLYINMYVYIYIIYIHNIVSEAIQAANSNLLEIKSYRNKLVANNVPPGSYIIVHN